jgi:hypothetical protein
VRRDTTSFLDGDQPIQMTLQTPWIKLQGLQGFGRIYRMSLLGEYRSEHELNVEMAYDYNDFTTHTLTFNTADSLGGSVYGSDSYYGETSPYGGTSDFVYQFRSRVPRQKMQSLRLTISDSSTTGESYSISDLALEVGIKSGLYKLPAAKTV